MTGLFSGKNPLFVSSATFDECRNVWLATDVTYIITGDSFPFLISKQVLHLNVRNWNDVSACSLCRICPIFRPDYNSVLLALLLSINIQRLFGWVRRSNSPCLLRYILGPFVVV